MVVIVKHGIGKPKNPYKFYETMNGPIERMINDNSKHEHFDKAFEEMPAIDGKQYHRLSDGEYDCEIVYNEWLQRAVYKKI